MDLVFIISIKSHRSLSFIPACSPELTSEWPSDSCSRHQSRNSVLKICVLESSLKATLSKAKTSGKIQRTRAFTEPHCDGWSESRTSLLSGDIVWFRVAGHFFFIDDTTYQTQDLHSELYFQPLFFVLRQGSAQPLSFPGWV